RGRPQLWDGRGRPALLMEGPERAVPQDQWFTGALDSSLHPAHANVVVAGAMNLHEAAFQPSHALLDERDAVGPQPVRNLQPGFVDGRCATREALGDEFLGATQHAHVESLALDYRCPSRRFALQADQH